MDPHLWLRESAAVENPVEQALTSRQAGRLQAMPNPGHAYGFAGRTDPPMDQTIQAQAAQQPGQSWPLALLLK